MGELRGSVRYMKRISRADLRSNPDTLFAFGDNMARSGLGGQAKECRGEPNAVGIPTKWRPAIDPGAYFSDADLDEVRPEIQRAFRQMYAHLENGGSVVWPADGVGTGLADLPCRAPRIARFIERCLARLKGDI